MMIIIVITGGSPHYPPVKYGSAPTAINLNKVNNKTNIPMLAL